MSTGLRGSGQSPKQGLARDYMRQRSYSHIPTDRVQVAAPKLGPSKPLEQVIKKTALVDDTTPAQGDRVALCGGEQPAQCHGDASNEGLFLAGLSHRRPGASMHVCLRYSPPSSWPNWTYSEQTTVISESRIASNTHMTVSERGRHIRGKSSRYRVTRPHRTGSAISRWKRP